MKCTSFSALLLSALSVGAATAHASTFDEQGRLSLDDSAVAFSLDSYSALPEGVSIRLFDANYDQLGDAEFEALFDPDPDGVGLEGSGAMLFGGAVGIFGGMNIRDLTTNLTGRRVAMNIWQRPEGTLADMSVSFSLGGGGGGPNSGYPIGEVPFMPTGRVTSDGWREFSTGPFDFAVGGVAAPSRIRMSDQQVTLLQSAFTAGFDYDARVRLDALEIVDLGPALVDAADCTSVDEEAMCGSQGVCTLGRCAEARVVEGAPPSSALVADYVERRIFEFETFEGGRVPQQRMAAMRAALEPLKSAEPDARFWADMRVAVDDLQDGHASAPITSLGFNLTAGVCLHLGQADLIDDEIRPMVFKRVGSGPLVTALSEGDVLVAVDALPVDEWVALNDRYLTHGGDPRAFDLVVAPNIINAAMKTGATMTFERCTPAVAGTPCADGETELIDIDAAALLGDEVWSGDVPQWMTDSPGCDWRFSTPIQSANTAVYEFAGAELDDDGINHLLINGVPNLASDEGQVWGNVVQSTLASAPSMLVLDQRQGRGGTIDAVDLLTGYLVDDSDYFSADLMSWWGVEESVAVKNAVMNCAEGASSSQSGCGTSFRWRHGFSLPQTGIAAGTKLAILNGQDVSGNDYTSRVLSMRSGETRFFGHGASYGAFGVIWQLPAYIGEAYGGSFQVHDTLFLSSPGDSNLDFATSNGIVPDEIVYQKQSDALAGIDTTLEAARTWLLAE